MSAKIKTLGSILPPELKEGQSSPVDEYIDTPLVFHTCTEREGTNGTYLRIVVSLLEDDKQFFITTGAAQPKEVLLWAKENRSFPFIAKFVKAGRAYLLRDTEQ